MRRGAFVVPEMVFEILSDSEESPRQIFMDDEYMEDELAQMRGKKKHLFEKKTQANEVTDLKVEQKRQSYDWKSIPLEQIRLRYRRNATRMIAY